MIKPVLSILTFPVRYFRDTLGAYGLTRSVSDQFSGTARRVTADGMIGAEDIAVDHATGVAYISAADRRLHRSGGPERGGLYSYNLNDPGSVPRRLSTPDGEIFPHGLALWRSPRGLELYVICHLHGRHTIRRYRVEDDQLQLAKTYEHQVISSPNDLTVVGEGEFYVTNDHYFLRTPAQKIEEFARLPLSYVVHVKDDHYTKALGRIPYANGICWYPERNELFVAAMLDREIWATTRRGDGRLMITRKFPTQMCVDNIEIGSDGWLWVGGHPQILKLVGHDKNQNRKSPTQVIRIDPQTGHVETVYENGGSQISGGSVGSNWCDRLLIGSVMEPFILDCTLTAPYCATGAWPR